MMKLTLEILGACLEILGAWLLLGVLTVIVLNGVKALVRRSS